MCCRISLVDLKLLSNFIRRLRNCCLYLFRKSLNRIFIEVNFFDIYSQQHLSNLVVLPLFINVIDHTKTVN